MPLNIAHRGASIHALENSREAFELAIALGADMIELDVHITRDGVPVVLHDDSLDRTTSGHGPVDSYTLAELQAFRLLNGETIPTLHDILDLCKGRIQFDIEIKVAEAYPGVLAALQDLNIGEEALITSFVPDVIRSINELEKPYRSALLIGQPTLNLGVRLNEAFPFFWLRKAKTDGISIYYGVLPDRLLNWLRKSNYKIYVWTVDSRPMLERFVQPYITGVITNRPDLFGAILKEKATPTEEPRATLAELDTDSETVRYKPEGSA